MCDRCLDLLHHRCLESAQKATRRSKAERLVAEFLGRFCPLAPCASVALPPLGVSLYGLTMPLILLHEDLVVLILRVHEDHVIPHPLAGRIEAPGRRPIDSILRDGCCMRGIPARC